MRMHATVPFLLLPILPIISGCQSKPTSVEISVIDGHREVLVDGRHFPDDRVEVRRRAIVLRDEQGRPWFKVPIDERTAAMMHQGPHGHGFGPMGHGPGPMMMGSPAVPTMPAQGVLAMPMPVEQLPEHWGDQPPPVMLGVMLEPGGEVAKRRGADPDRSSHIPDLAEHHPAGRHGLQDGDLIVWFNGQDDASPAAIRAALRKMQPGDQVFFKVLRGDGPDMKQVEATVTVEPFDLGKMVREEGMPMPGMGPGPDGDPFFDLHMRLDQIEGMLGEILRRMDQRRGQMGGGPGTGPGPGPGPGPGNGPGPGPGR